LPSTPTCRTSEPNSSAPPSPSSTLRGPDAETSFAQLFLHGRQDRTDGLDASDTTISYIGTVALDAKTIAAAGQMISFGVEHIDESFQNNDSTLVFDPSQMDEQTRDLTSLIGQNRGVFIADRCGSACKRNSDSLSVQLIGLTDSLPSGLRGARNGSKPTSRGIVAARTDHGAGADR